MSKGRLRVGRCSSRSPDDDHNPCLTRDDLRSARRHLRPKPTDEVRERYDHAHVPLSEQRREDVLADAVAPEMVAAITPRMRGRVKVHPMILGASGHEVLPLPYALAAKPQAPLQPAEIHPAGGIEIDRHVFHHLLPIQAIVTRNTVYATACAVIIVPERKAKVRVRFRAGDGRARFLVVSAEPRHSPIVPPFGSPG
jgi:hypothetical protein